MTLKHRLTRRLTANGRAGWHQRRYRRSKSLDGPVRNFSLGREDRTCHLRASVHNRALTFFGFSPKVSLIHEVRNTNAQIYDYKRTGGELRVVRQF